MKERMHQNIGQYEHEIKIKEEIYEREVCFNCCYENDIDRKHDEIDGIGKGRGRKNKKRGSQ